VVKRVLEVTVRELARVGYGSLSIEEVARRAAVNKTTVYRRWPTKLELARSAVFSLVEPIRMTMDTGTLRSDLQVFLRQAARFFASPQGGGLIRMAFAEGRSPGMSELTTSLLRKSEVILSREIVRRAIARGEVPAGTDPDRVLATLTGALLHHQFVMGGPVTPAWIEDLVDLVLTGVLHGGGVRPRATRRATPGGAARRPAGAG
jgi:AcrR family transcriptional regulator